MDFLLQSAEFALHEFQISIVGMIALNVLWRLQKNSILDMIALVFDFSWLCFGM